MRILELGKYYPPSRGGMETTLRQLCEGLVRRGHRVRVLVAAETARNSAEVPSGVEVRRLASWGRLRSVPLTPGLPLALRRSLAEFGPDRVHLHLPNPGMTLAWWLFGKRRIPLVISYHSDIVRQRWLSVLLEPVRQRLLGRACSILVSSEALLEESRSLGPHRDRCRVVPFGVELPPERVPVDAAEGEPFFLFVGRLVYYKGLGVLVDAMADSPMRLIVVGEGPERHELESRARRLGLSDRVRFLGDRDEAQLSGLYRACRALVLPSTAESETFGLVQLEAMAHGRPVIATRASGGMVSVHQEDKTGLLVMPGDAGALGKAMRRLWDHPEMAEEMGRAAREHVAQHFSLAASLDAQVQALEECVA